MHKQFGDKEFGGTVTTIDVEEGSGKTIYGVVYDDGDVEDFYAGDLQKLLYTQEIVDKAQRYDPTTHSYPLMHSVSTHTPSYPPMFSTTRPSCTHSCTQSPTHTLSHPLMNAPSHPPPPSAACSYSRYLETRKRAICLFEHYPVLDFEIEPGRGTARQRFYEGLYVNMKLVPLAPFRETSTNRYCYVHNICICLHRHTQNQHSPNHLPPTHTHWSWKRSRSERILVCVHACARVCECKRILVCVLQ